MKKNLFNEDALLGFENSNEKISDEEYKVIKKQIDSFLENQTSKSKLENKILSLKYKMEEYVEETNTENTLLVGNFIKELINILNIKNNIFAEYLGISKYDFSKLINGKRKISTDLAIKLGYIFNIKPNLWIEIEIKNDLLKFERNIKTDYKKYTLDDLIKN